jgi:tetratricopeptide (TPR) repeat protein
MSIFRKTSAPSKTLDEASAGDRARDVKDWAGAVAHYEAYLTGNPTDAGIWVQLGNCAKEAGDFKTSILAYHEALKLTPSNGDAHLQLGHLHKIMGRENDAIKSYRMALECDPSLSDARHEIVSLNKSIVTLSFLMTDTFLDFIRTDSIIKIIELAKKCDRKNDPFVKYRSIVKC